MHNSSNTNDIQDVQDNFGKQSLNFIGESLSIVTVLWWVDLGWMPGAHKAALITPVLSRTGR